MISNLNIHLYGLNYFRAKRVKRQYVTVHIRHAADHVRPALNVNMSHYKGQHVTVHIRHAAEQVRPALNVNKDST